MPRATRTRNRRRAWLLIAATCMCGAGISAQPRPEPMPTAAALASRLVRLADASERRALLDRYSELVDAALARALVDEARRLIDATELHQARLAYEIAIEVAGKLGERTALASALIGIGSVHGRQGDYPRASDALRAGLDLAEALGDVTRIDAALHNLGVVHRLQGEYEEALDYYGRVVALANETGRAHELGATFNNIGVVHTMRGSYRDALEALQQSLRLKEAAGERASLSSTLTNIGTVHVHQGHPELALDYYRKSLEVAEALGLMPQRAGTLNDIGHANAMLGRHEIAREYYRRALAQHEAAGRRAEVGATLYNLGRSYLARGAMEASLDHFTRSLSLRQSINDRPGESETLTALGELALARGDAPAALELAERATGIASETGSRESFWQARLVAGRSQQRLGRLDAAQAAYLDAIETIESLRAEVSSGERNRQRYFERKLEPYHRLVALSIARHRFEDALAIAERARARVLLEVMQEGPVERRLLTPAERARERAIERQLSELRTRLWAAQSSGGAALERARSELRAARLAHGDFRAALYAAHPTLQLQRGDTLPGTLDDVAALLGDAATGLIEFVVAEDATHVFLLSRPQADGADTGVQLTAFSLDLPRDRIRRLVAAFRQQLEQRDLEFQPAARELFDALLGRAVGTLPNRTNLIIVPDGPLWELPFHALRSERGYLIEHASVSYAPSIAVLRELGGRHRSRGSTGPPTLVALGDPRIPQAAPGLGAAPALAPLPDAARQVRALAELYGPGRSVVRVGAEASERVLRETSADATVLHLATHGLLDNAAPMYSYLQLAGDAGAHAATDGRLEAWEVADLQLPVEAVIVAACDTALGRIGPGEGMIGLSWAFFLAGSPRTVASLWKVDARSTTDLVVAFHQRFRDGLIRDRRRPGAAASLREAVLSLLRTERYRHPFYWAGLVLVGDGS